MNAEGAGVVVTAELIQTIVTGIPVGLMAWWLLMAVGALWRRQIWREVGRSIRRLEGELQGKLRARGAGWRLLAPDGTRLEWRGTLAGPVTRLRVPTAAGKLTVRRRGLLGLDEVQAELLRVRALGSPEAAP